jgi:hypothetical protein
VQREPVLELDQPDRDRIEIRRGLVGRKPGGARLHGDEAEPRQGDSVEDEKTARRADDRGGGDPAATSRVAIVTA